MESADLFQDSGLIQKTTQVLAIRRWIPKNGIADH